MLKNLNATKKGLITGLAMIALTLSLFYSKQSVDNPVQYIIYVLYAIGVVWVLYDFYRAVGPSAKFGEYFLQGFKCFIVVTLLMVIFTVVFNMLHPEFKEQMAVAYREELVKKGDMMVPEINSNVEKMRSYYIVMLISGAIFGYLLIGALVTLVATLLFRSRK